MCGITGVFAPNIPDIDQAASLMASALQHRGPDGYGIWSDPTAGVSLAHRRLSIIDLSEAGRQPMNSSDGRFLLTFNGEIYNHQELRATLEQYGAATRWKSQSDTETLIEAIAFWGVEEALRRVRGMFAVGIWDSLEQTLYLARDRMGEKPLYWGWAGSSLVFGSELKALKSHPAFQSTTCPLALAQFFRFAYVPAPRSIYAGVFKLEPGCLLKVVGRPPACPPERLLRPGDQYGSICLKRYWKIEDSIEQGLSNLIYSENDALDQLEAVLSKAIKRQSMSDVPIGAFLSGGIDSSLIVALMQSQSHSPVNTFTIAFESASYNEAPAAARIAKHLGCQHTEVMVTEREARDVIPALPTLFDEPFADSSQIPTHLVCSATRNSVTVALSGDAGDELFGGYSRYTWIPKIWRQIAWLPPQVRNGLGILLTKAPLVFWAALGQLLGEGINRPVEKAAKLAQRLRNTHSIDVLYRNIVSEWPNEHLVLGNSEELECLLDDQLPASLNDSPVARMMVQDMRTYLPDDILCKVDRAAMGVSLETRVPFLDPDVIDFSFRLPIDMKIRNGQGKWPLRQLLQRHVPKELFDRPKTGFAIPVGDWLRGPLKSWAQDLLSTDKLRREGIIDPAPVARAWKEHLSGKQDHSQRLWTVLMFQSWLENGSAE